MNAAVQDGGALRAIADRLVRLPEDRQRIFLKQIGEHGIDLQQLPIVAGPRPARVPLSHAQQQQWLLWKMRPDSAAYHLALPMRLRGDVDTVALQKTFDAIVARHESLRTSFRMEENHLAQVIAPEATVRVRLLEADSVGSDARTIRTLMARELRRPFDLEAGLPIRVTLIRLAPREHVLLVVLHHIVADAWSLDLMLEELGALYSAQCHGREAALTELPIQYADLAIWQRHWMKEKLDEQLTYWREQLGEAVQSQELLPPDRPRVATPSYRAETFRFDFDAELSTRLMSFAGERGVTLFTVLVASLKVLLFRYSGQRDLRVGTPVANRHRIETERLIGFLVNTVVLRTDLSGDPSFDTVVSRVSRVIRSALTHQDLPFAQLVEALNPQRSFADNPLFQVLYTHEIGRRSKPIHLPGLEVEPLVQEHQTAQVDLSVATTEREGSFSGSVLYATELYDSATIERFVDHWRNLLRRMIENPRVSVASVDLLGATERTRVLAEWNRTSLSRGGPESLHGLIEAQVAKTPNAICVVRDGATLDFASLDECANSVATRLQASGVGPDDRVAVCMSRSLELVVSLFGILKAGAAYVPLDPDYPSSRLAFMLSDAKPRAVLTQHTLAPLIRGLGIDVPAWNMDGCASVAEHDVPLPRVATAVSPDNLAYCIYTSGSTGLPKGVSISHRGIVNFLQSFCRRPGLRQDDRLLALASLSFDMACLDVFLPLMAGGRLVLVDRAVAIDPSAILECIRREGITVVQATPTMWSLLVARDVAGVLSQCKVLSGGESLPLDLADRLIDRAQAVWNVYGPTETTVYSAVHELTGRHREPLVGKPIDNTVVHLLNECLQPVPVGVTGDLYIGGAGVARGYFGRPALTADRFTPNPFGKGRGERLYRTGDLGRYRPDGVIECLGRSDHQVKIRGFRIELGEIEAQLRTHPAVREAAVAAHVGSDGMKFLVAYIVPTDSQVFATEASGDSTSELFRQLSEHVKARLPQYMVPAHFVCMEGLPETPNGKLDRKALAAPLHAGHARREFATPRSSLEGELVALWQDALGVNPIGIHDNFFELGGHSLLAVQLSETLSRSMGRDVPLSQLFQSQTVAELAEALSTVHKRNDANSLVILEASGSRPALCCIHPGGGQLLGYRGLARSCRDHRPVYGLQSRLFYRDDWVDDSIESMAAHYAQQIARQTQGRPVHLLGWSAGCFIAAETLRCLEERGQRVLSLAMIDPVAFLDADVMRTGAQSAEPSAHAEDRVSKWIAQTRHRVQWQKLLELCDSTTRMDLIGRLFDRGLDTRSLSVAEEYVLLTEAQFFLLMKKYTFRAVHAVTNIWWASDTLRTHASSVLRLPADMAHEVATVEADHLSIVNSPELHRQLQTLLDDRDGQR